MLSVNTNISSLESNSQLDKSRKKSEQLLDQLSSGTRLTSASVDAANSAISQTLEAQVRGQNQAVNNAYDGVSMLQTADGALSQLQSNSQQIQDLAIQAGNGALSSANRQSLQQQVDQLTQANSAIVQSTTFNGTALLNGGNSQTFQIGANGSSDNQLTVSTPNLSASAASGGLSSYNSNLNATGTIDITTPANAVAAQSSISNDLNALSNSRTQLGAASNQFEAAINNLQNSSVNLQAAKSRISDTDFAAALSQLTQQQILGQAAVATQAQANVSARSALSLLSG